ncbi:MAG: M1 family peptidase [Bacteroidota bacterium]|nr:M1 family peptidase [Bacteroidota bacterium]
MILRIGNLLPFLLLLSVSTWSQTTYRPYMDVLHYDFHVRVTDQNDSLEATAGITVQYVTGTDAIVFDLKNRNDTGKGMQVSAVSENGKPLKFSHIHDLLRIDLSGTAAAKSIHSYQIEYGGIPADGLIISQNQFHRRTIFADNWPNRASYWIPCVDHPSDKATVDFWVTAPQHYKAIANGDLQEEKLLGNQEKLTHWSEKMPLPTKVMVIGLADFAVDYPGTVDGIPVSSWIFPENKKAGFSDYAQATTILPFFIKHIGPYNYSKLANVQSRTIFGGMENAGTIFYYDKSVTGTGKNELLMVHEIAHQWFGDAATETDWPHLWLSEGFATEMTHLYVLNKYGQSELVKGLEKDRKEVIAFTKKRKTPVVDTTAANDIKALLNTNSYQKGGWVLEMLRQKLGDSLFWKGIQVYYARYRNANASTPDLQKVFEEVSNRKLDTFFHQWLYRPENPDLQIEWQYHPNEKQMELSIQQKTKEPFQFPLELLFTDSSGKETLKTILLEEPVTKFRFPYQSKPAKVIADPDCHLLYEGTLSEKFL